MSLFDLPPVAPSRVETSNVDDNDSDEPKGKRQRPYLGAVVVNGQMRYGSVSQIKLFRKEDDGCKRKWVFRYRLRQKLAKTDALTTGIGGAEKLEHYLTTGEDVLPPVLQAVKAFLPSPRNARGELDLECEKPLGDMPKALAMRDALLGQPPGSWPQLLRDEIQKFAGLTAAGIPIDGAADCRHTRGEYVDSVGELRREDPRARVVEICDLKIVGQIFPRTILRGPNAGSVVPAYTKTDAQVCEDVQMVGYGRHAMDLHPDATHARLGHWYANKKKLAEAVKRHGLVSRQELVDRWEGVFAPVVADMAQHAGAERVGDVEPNVSACDSFTHQVCAICETPLFQTKTGVACAKGHADPPSDTRKGCGHRYTCPLSTSQIAPHMLGKYKESAMSLFDQAPGSPAPTAPTPPPAPPPQSAVSAADYAAQVEEEKRRLLAAQPVSASYGFCARCGAALSAVNASRLADGVTVVHMDCPQAQTQPPSPPLRPTPPIPPPAPPAAPSAPPAASPAVTVNPPDQPKASSLLDAAAPLPPEEIAKITDPALKAKVEEHARQHAERAAAEARRLEQEKIAAGTSAWCAVNKQRMLVDSAMSVNGYTCQCTRHWTLKALEPVKEGDQYFVVIPRHKPKNKASQQAANGQVNGQVNGAAQSQQQSLPGTAAPAPEAAPASGWSSRDDLALKVGRGLLDAIDQYIAALTSTFDDEIEGVD